MYIDVQYREHYGARGHNVYIDGFEIGHRPYDGSDADDVRFEVMEALASLLQRELGWEKDPYEDWGDDL